MPGAMNVTTVVDAERCTGCGLCLRVCPSGTLSLDQGVSKVVVSGDYCMACGHCQAVCPADAVHVGALDPASTGYETFSHDQAWLPHGEYDLPGLVRLMRSRRSCRNYRPDPVDPALLRDLVRIGATAPSGTNSQTWAFTVLPTRPDVEVLATGVSEYFRGLNKMARKRWLCALLKLVGKPDLAWYRREYLNTVEKALAAWDRDQTDRLFHHAPSAIVVTTRPGASCPGEDALLASQNMLLAAHAMGLGTCLIGFAVSAMGRDAAIKARVGIPANETVHAVLAIGHPNERYQEVAGRKQLLLRAFDRAGRAEP